MIYLECTIHRPVNLRAMDVIAVVEDKNHKKEQLEVELAFLVKRGNRYFLPVWALAQDHERRLVEIEFPQESAGGTNRIWVRADQLFVQNEEVPA